MNLQNKLKLIVNELYFFPKITVFTRNKTHFSLIKMTLFYNLGGIINDYKSLLYKKRTPKIDFNKIILGDDELYENFLNKNERLKPNLLKY